MDTRRTSSPGSNNTRNKKNHELLKLVFLGLLCVGFYFGAQQIGRILARTRGTLTSTSLSILVPCFIVIMVCRRLFPPVWYLVPTGALMVVVLVLKLGWVEGVLTYQSLKLVDFLSWLFIRKYYSSLFNDMEAPLEVGVLPSSTRPAIIQNKFWWLPETLFSIIRVLDSEWKSRIESCYIPMNNQNNFNKLKQVSIVAAFGVSWYIEEEAMLYWFAVRSDIDKVLFGAGLAAYTYLNVPDMLVRAKVFKAVFLAAEENSLKLFWEQIQNTNVMIVVLLFAIATPATVYIHSTHIKLLIENMCSYEHDRFQNEGEEDLSSNVAPNERVRGDGFNEEDAKSRDARKAQLLQQQRLNLELN